jgi:hypothetical protein
VDTTLQFYDQTPETTNLQFNGYTKGQNIAIGASEMAFSVVIIAGGILAAAAIAPETIGASAFIGFGAMTMGSSAFAVGLGRVTGLNNRPIIDDAGDIFLPAIYEVGKALSNYRRKQ